MVGYLLSENQSLSSYALWYLTIYNPKASLAFLLSPDLKVYNELQLTNTFHQGHYEENLPCHKYPRYFSLKLMNLV